MIEGIYGFSGDYHFLSNMYISEGCTIDQIEVPSNEHRYQAHKAKSNLGRDYVLYKDLVTWTESAPFDHMKFTSPFEAKKRGRMIPSDRLWWEENKIKVMYDGLVEKFSNPELKEKLLDTGDLYIEETNRWGDQFWGVCDGQGKNILGLLLMKVRKAIRENAL